MQIAHPARTVPWETFYVESEDIKEKDTQQQKVFSLIMIRGGVDNVEGSRD